jgi:uncharacterized protein with ParB-like and HNH nuclease domain/alkylated DNA nucleotide flippase Atl1
MVAAREISVQQLLEGSVQYQIPLYQRTYSWKRVQLERLWDDILQLAEDRIESPQTTHFMGSLVLAGAGANGPGGVHEYLVVDGQQRLTTLSLLLTAIRDHRREHESPEHFDRINEMYLMNKWKKSDHRYKLSPTQADRESYRACIDATPQAGGTDGIGETYRFFKAALVAADDPEDEFDIERLEDAVISGLSLVSVTTAEGDNTHRIFESLNNTGLKLTQGDLLRNYIFMRLPSQGDAVYSSLWLPLQNLLSADDLELLFWLDLVQDHPTAKQSEIYSLQKRQMDRLASEADIKAEVERFARLGHLWSIILSPDKEEDPQVRLRLQRLKAWGTTTVYPIVLFLMDRRDQGTASSATIAQAMLYLESFLVRRLIAGRAQVNINRILLQAVSDLEEHEDVAEGLHRYLSSGRKYFLGDEALGQALRSVPFYLNGRSPQRKLVLQWLEESFQSREPVKLSTLTIEHVMPRTLSDGWREALSTEIRPDERLEDVHEALQHTLGNLTLTGYNSALSNSPFETKRTMLAESGLRMNQAIAKEASWGRREILARADQIAERVKEIWPGPLQVAETSQFSPSWALMEQAVAALPPGRWTSYGDLATLIGSHPMPVGQRIASHPVENGHRVLQTSGTISAGFRWYESGRTDDPHEVLSQEGVRFDERGQADPLQRVSVDELAALIGADVEAPKGVESIPDGGTPERQQSFGNQMFKHNGTEEVGAVLELIRSWVRLGGDVDYGTAALTSCFLIHSKSDGHQIWPLVIYPDGSVEIVLQYLANRPPFDDDGLRLELLRRINALDEADISEDRINGRPNIRFELLTRPGNLEKLVETLTWFRDSVQEWEKSRAQVFLH